jgi:hypothetical protein
MLIIELKMTIRDKMFLNQRKFEEKYNENRK